MDKLTGEQQIRAVALEAASRIVSENLGRFVNLGSIPDNKMYAEMAANDLAKRFETYVRGDGR